VFEVLVYKLLSHSQAVVTESADLELRRILFAEMRRSVETVGKAV
jgi:hypothetical protein